MKSHPFPPAQNQPFPLFVRWAFHRMGLLARSGRRSPSEISGRNTIRVPGLLLAVILSHAAMSASAQGTVTDPIVVNALDAGAGSLRQAIFDATPGSTITFDTVLLSGATIPLSTGPLEIEKDLTIDASSLALPVTISGENSSRIFIVRPDYDIFDPPTPTVVLDSLVITNGLAANQFSDGSNGGGINLGEAHLTIRNSTISNNQADPVNGHGGGIANFSGTLIVQNSTITGNHAPDGWGGGISNFGTPLPAFSIFENSTISGNHAIAGGGIASDGSTGGGYLTIRNSTLKDNHASNATYGGGEGGGAIHSYYETLTIQNSTISNNQVDVSNENGGHGGGIWQYGESLTIENSTITGNRAAGRGLPATQLNSTGGSGGGIYLADVGVAPDPVVTLSNTIVAGNQAGTGEVNGMGNDIFGNTYSITRSGNNLIGDNTTVATDFPAPLTPGLPNANGDLVGTTGTPFDPELGPLADNGGPTETRNPLPDSPVIDFGDASVLPNDAGDLDNDLNTAEPLPLDQRGLARVHGENADLGAVEYQVIPDPVNPQLRRRVLSQIRKTKKMIKQANRKKKKAKAKRLKRKLKKLKRKLRAL